MILVGQPYGVRSHQNISVGSTPVLIADRDPNRKCLLVQNQGATASIFLGKASTVAASGDGKGLEVAAGQTFVDAASTDGWHAITSGAGVNVHIVEVS